MSRRWTWRLCASLLALLLPSCGAISNGSPAPLSLRPTSATMTVRLIVVARPRAAPHAHERKTQFISADTAGVQLALTGSATISTTLDISPGSTACGGSHSSPRTCSGAIPVPAGSYSLTATSYDQAPVANAIPSGAHELGAGTVSGITIVTGATNMTTVYLGGLITAYAPAAAFVSVSGNTIAQQIGFVFAPQDYDGETISAGTNDPYTNPITLTLTESGGSGHETLVRNGINVGTSATIAHSTDSVQISYDGGGAAGYYATVAIAATGVTTSQIHVSPMYVVPAGSYATNNNGIATVNFEASGETSSLAITEASAVPSVTYAVSANAACSGVVTASAISGSGASASTTLTAGSTQSDSGCTVTITDNLGTSTQVVVAVTLRGVTQHAGLSSGPLGITNGSDGNVWFTENTGVKIGQLNVSTFAVTEYSGLTSAPREIVSGPDGNLWITENLGNKIAQFNPTTHAIAEYSIGLSVGANPYGITVGSDNNIWFTENGAANIGTINPTTHVITQYPAGHSQTEITSGPDGNLWFTETTQNKIGVLNISTHVVTLFPTTGAGPKGITTGPNSKLWFVELSANQVGTIDPITHVITEFGNGMSPSASPSFIVTGPDGNLWFTEQGAAAKIGMVNPTTHVITEYALPSGAPADILSFAGYIWFSQLGVNVIGQLTP